MNLDDFFVQNAPNAKVAPWEHFFDQNDPSAFETVITNGFGRLFGPKTLLGAQNAFWSYFSTFGPKSRAPGRCYIRVKTVQANFSNF